MCRQLEPAVAWPHSDQGSVTDSDLPDVGSAAPGDLSAEAARSSEVTATPAGPRSPLASPGSRTVTSSHRLAVQAGSPCGRNSRYRRPHPAGARQAPVQHTDDLEKRARSLEKRAIPSVTCRRSCRASSDKGTRVASLDMSRHVGLVVEGLVSRLGLNHIAEG